MYFKPSEIYLPEGDYWLSYFVGDQNLVLPKTRIDVSLAGGATKGGRHSTLHPEITRWTIIRKKSR